MTDAATLAPTEDERLTFILPGSWARIPLESESASNGEISRILKSRIPRRDEFAQMRRETREVMRGLAGSAREVGAVFLALSLEIVPGIPFPASIVAAYVDAAVADPDATVEERLLAASPGGELLRLESGPTVRAIDITERTEDEQGATTVDLVYVLPTPSDSHWLQVVADIPTEVEPELILELFDAIVGSIRWSPAGPVDAPASP